jgi:hypothetical protein
MMFSLRVFLLATTLVFIQFVYAFPVYEDELSPTLTVKLDNAIFTGATYLNDTVDRFLGIPYGEST